MRLFVTAVCLLLVAGCSTGGVPASTTVPATTTSVTTTSAPPTTTTRPAETTTTVPRLLADLRIAWVRHDPATLVLTSLAGDAPLEIPLDRRFPMPFISDDGAGGLVAVWEEADGDRIWAVVAHLPAGATEPETSRVLVQDMGPISIGTSGYTPAGAGGTFGLTYLTRLGTATKEGQRTYIDWDTSLVFHPIGGEPATLVTVPGSMVWDDELWDIEREYGLVTGSVGGDTVAYVDESELRCDRLVVADAWDTIPIEVPIDFGEPNVEGCPAYPYLPMVSGDGSVLFGLVPGDFGSDFAAWDLATGAELVRLEQVHSSRLWFDGDATVLLQLATGSQRPDLVVVTATREESSIVEMGDVGVGEWWDLVGIVTRPVAVAHGASLISPDAWACSAAGAVPLDSQELPPAVAATREAIWEAVAACDLFALAGVAGEDLSYTAESVHCDYDTTIVIAQHQPPAAWDAVPLWYRADQAVGELATMIDVLRMPFTEDGDGYTWSNPDGYTIVIDRTGAWTFNGRTWPSDCAG